MFDREDIAAVASAAAAAVRRTFKNLETRLVQLEQRASSGIQSIDIRNHDKDRRSFVQTVTMLDGRKIESTFKLVGSMFYCEIHQVGRRYEMGDAVTHDGSIWVALRDTVETPGKSSDWRLAVKRGQDGKNLK